MVKITKCIQASKFTSHVTSGTFKVTREFSIQICKSNVVVDNAM